MTSHVEVFNFLTKRQSRDRSDLEQEFISLCKVTGAYDQVRVIDKSGMELIRVNYNEGCPAAVPVSQLQNKATRYYFTEAIVLDPGEIYM